ncbi:hypothetical protein Hanom_Chr10g00932241 [Helianthus anomalus]
MRKFSYLARLHAKKIDNSTNCFFQTFPWAKPILINPFKIRAQTFPCIPEIGNPNFKHVVCCNNLKFLQLVFIFYTVFLSLTG